MIITSLAWMAATLAVIASATALAKRLDPGSGSFAVVHVIVIAWTWVVAVAATLSVGHRLTGAALIAGVLAVALATAIGCASWNRRWPAASPGDGVEPRTRWPAFLWGALICLWAGHVASGGLLRFTTDWDSLMYHIPLIDYWLQASSLYAPASGQWSNPGGNELLGLWAVAPFPNDSLVMLGNIPATLLLTFGALELGRLLGLAPVVRHSAALAVVSNYVVMKQLVDAENDVAVAGLFVACLCYGLRAARGDRASGFLLGPAALGLLCGVKYYALGLATVAWSSATLMVWSRRGARAGARSALIWVVGAGLVGGFWYARNAIVTGSPFFPMVAGRGPSPLAMDYPSPWQTTFLGNGKPEVWDLAIEAVWKMTGPCQLVAVYAFPAVVTWLSLAGFGLVRGVRLENTDRLMVALAMAGSAAVLWITPMALEDVPGTLNHLRWSYTPIRYGLGALSLATIGLALTIQDVCGSVLRPSDGEVEAGRGPGPRGWRPSILGAALGGSALFQTAGLGKGLKVDWITSLQIAVVLGVASLAASHLWTSGGHARRTIAFAMGLIAMILAAWVIRDLSGKWDVQFTDFYDRNYNTRAIGQLTSLRPKPSLVAYYDYRCYPFFGPRREVRLCQQKPVASFEHLVVYLSRQGVSHLVVRSDDSVKGYDNYRNVKPWLDMHRTQFELVHSDETHAIYRFIQAVEAAHDQGSGRRSPPHQATRPQPETATAADRGGLRTVPQ